MEAFGGQPAVVIEYGPSGIGKTTQDIFSFPNALFIAGPGALKPMENVVGIQLRPDQIRDVATVDEATKLIISESKLRKYDAVVVDDMSLLADRTFNEYEKRLSGFKLWGAIRNSVLLFRDTCRTSRMHTIMNAHEAGPRTMDGFFIRGGPRLPGKLPEDLPAAADLVLRVQADSNRLGWHAMFRCTIDDPNYVSKDRHGVTPDYAPFNLREILRSAGYRLSRWPGLEWQDAVADGITHGILALPPNVESKDVLQKALDYMRQQGYADLYIRWALRDGLDRAILSRARKASVFSGFGII